MAGSAPLAPAPDSVTITNEIKAELLRPSENPFTLGPGDRLDIEIIGRPASRATVTVGPDGKIYYQLLPGMDVWGLTLTQTRELLEKEMSKFLNEPQLALTLREVGSKSVWLLGRLNRPGIYPITGTMTLLECLAQAGGAARSSSQVSTEELADLRHSFVMRQGQFLPVDFYRLFRQGDMSQNIYLQPDDFVYVPSAYGQEVYIFGAVRAPRVAPYLDQMTLVSAISGSAGTVKYDLIASGVDGGPFTPDAYLSHVAIVRGSLSTPKVTVVDYGAILKGKAQDILLEPGDIIYIPNSPYTNLKRYVNLIINSFIGTVAANEGIHAAGGQVGVGVSVPVGSGTSTR
jgi:protein involved in polysaccharide export with SLBB domain